MQDFPDVILDEPFIGQKEYKSDVVDVLQIDDRVFDKQLRAFCQLGTNTSLLYWVPVLSGDDYTVNWTNEMVANAIKSYFVNPPA